MPDARFESESFSSFGDMMSQTFLLKKGKSNQIQIINPQMMGLTWKKLSFYVQNCSFKPKMYPSFQAKEIFSLSNFFRRLDEKKQQQPPGLTNFARIWAEYASKLKLSHKVWAS